MKRSYFTKGGQKACFHDEGDPAGFYHTYDNFKVPSSNNEYRKIHIFLPRDYETSGLYYPTVYFNDGNTTFFSGGLTNTSWDVAGKLNALYELQKIPKMIIVAINPISPLARDQEYTSLNENENINLVSYTGFVIDELKRFIDLHYRTLPGSNNNMIIGSSNGGYAAFFIGCFRLDTFGLIAALSPSFWIDVDCTNDFPQIVNTSTSIRSSKLIKLINDNLFRTRIRPKIYLDWGLVRTGGLHNSSIERFAEVRGQEMIDILQTDYKYQIGKDLYVYEDKTGEHTEFSWGNRLSNILMLFQRVCIKRYD